jgi:Protein of unknown function (DUF2975)
MKRTNYYWALSILYWGCILALLFLGFGVACGIFLSLKGPVEIHEIDAKTGTKSYTRIGSGVFVLNEIPANYLIEPITSAKLSVDFHRAIADSVVRYRFKNQYGYGSSERIVNRKLIGSETNTYLDTENERLLKNGFEVVEVYTTRLGAYSLPTDNATYETDILKSEFAAKWVLMFPTFYAHGSVLIKAKGNWDKFIILTTNWIQAILPTIARLFLLFQATMLFRNLRNDYIFTLGNFKRIRFIGSAFFLMWLGNSMSFVRSYFLKKSLNNVRIHIDSYLDGIPAWPDVVQLGIYRSDIPVGSLFLNEMFITSLFIIILAEVFRRGFELKQDQDLTI